ncbi:MAG: cation-translocating P-type ATPase [Dehalococcoidia bacterium]
MYTSEFTGLSEQQAAERLKEDGLNQLPSTARRSVFAIAYGVVREPMFLLLVAGGLLYFLLGEIQEGFMLLGFVFVVMGITFSQERKTERALEALRDLSSPRALVIRDGVEKRIAGRDVVNGDLLIVKEGDRVPADAVMLACSNLSIDESLLTGESVSVRKVACEGTREMERPGGDDLPCIYSSTLVVQGQGIARVKGTGLHTEIGKIGKSLQTLETESTALQQETGKLVRNLAILGLSLSVVVIVVYGLTRGNWIEGILAGVALAMAVLPEEFPVVLVIFLALGAWRISKNQVLTRRVPAVETLGSATVLCVDKTGTLTLNRMSVSKLFAGGKYWEVHDSEKSLPEEFHRLIEYGILASQRDPFDPMEKAITQLGQRYLDNTEHLHRNWTLEHEYPLSKNLLAMSEVWKSPEGSDYVIAAKGAPEAIADLCHLDAAQTEDLMRHIRKMADEGLRLLGVAAARFSEPGLPGTQHDFKFELVGLLGLTDPVRPGVAEAVRECNTAGIRVVMITGDYSGTAQNIARQIGLEPNDAVITGAELDKMNDSELQQRIQNVSIFARVVPEQKLRLVNALKANGEVVAMTGDGVNDAPALKSAHIGIAMGGRGTDVARESSALVLLDDDFSSIVGAVRMGRRIFANIKKALVYILAIHVPIAGLSLIPVFLDWPLILLPVQIVFLELIIDPTCSIIFEAEPAESGVMSRPPRDPKEPLFGRATIALSLLQGMGILLICLTIFGIAYYSGRGAEESRTFAFTTLVIANLGLIFTNRSWSQPILTTLRSPNPAMWWITIGATLLLGIVLYVPFVNTLFKFTKLHPLDIGICLAAGLVCILWFEGLKKLSGWQPNTLAHDS